MRSIQLLQSAVAALAAEDLGGVPALALADDLEQLRRAIDGLEAQWLRRLEAFDRLGAAATGAASTAAWVRSACRLAPGQARVRVELARALPGLPETADALAAGDISLGHAHLVATTVAELADAAGALTAAEAEPSLVDLARLVDPTRLRRELVHARHALAPDATAAAADEAHRRRALSVSETFGGMVAVDGMLDPEGGATLMTALTALSAPSGPDDTRTPRQRRADAVVELARRQLDAGQLPSVGGERPHLTVLVELATLERRAGAGWADHHTSDPAIAGALAAKTRRADPRAADPRTPNAHAAHRPAADSGAADPPAAHQRAADPRGPDPHTAAHQPAAGSGRADPRAAHQPAADSGAADPHAAHHRAGDPRNADDRTVRTSAARHPDDPSAGTASAAGTRPAQRPLGPRAAEIGWAGPISGEAARRLACDAGISRVITDGASQPLDVGRRTRTIPAAIRTALAVRDRGCAWPSCDRPPQWTDAHHVVSWIDGGATSLDNLVLLCRIHHRTVHEGRWRLSRTAAGRWTATPPGPAPPLAA